MRIAGFVIRSLVFITIAGCTVSVQADTPTRVAEQFLGSAFTDDLAARVQNGPRSGCLQAPPTSPLSPEQMKATLESLMRLCEDEVRFNRGIEENRRKANSAEGFSGLLVILERANNRWYVQSAGAVK